MLTAYVTLNSLHIISIWWDLLQIPLSLKFKSLACMGGSKIFKHFSWVWKRNNVCGALSNCLRANQGLPLKFAVVVIPMFIFQSNYLGCDHRPVTEETVALARSLNLRTRGQIWAGGREPSAVFRDPHCPSKLERFPCWCAVLRT